MAKFQICDLVKIKLTSHVGMVIDVHEQMSETGKNYRTGYSVRLPNYQVRKFYDYELAEWVPPTDANSSPSGVEGTIQ